VAFQSRLPGYALKAEEPTAGLLDHFLEWNEIRRLGILLAYLEFTRAYISIGSTASGRMYEAPRMNGRLLNALKVACCFLPLFALTSCCGKFFPDSTDVVAVTISPTNASVLPGGTQQFKATGTFGSSSSGSTGDVTSTPCGLPRIRASRQSTVLGSQRASRSALCPFPATAIVTSPGPT